MKSSANTSLTTRLPKVLQVHFTPSAQPRSMIWEGGRRANWHLTSSKCQINANIMLRLTRLMRRVQMWNACLHFMLSSHRLQLPTSQPPGQRRVFSSSSVAIKRKTTVKWTWTRKNHQMRLFHSVCHLSGNLREKNNMGIGLAEAACKREKNTPHVWH